MPKESIKDISSKLSSKCTHCNEVTNNPIHDGDVLFCCYGCQTVYQALKEKNLLTYYKLREQSGDNTASPVPNTQSIDFNYLNEEKFQSEFLKATPQGLEAKFYLEGIHCIACVWLLEKTPTFINGILSSRVQLGLSTVDLVVEPGADLAEIAQEFVKMGYRPHPVKSSDEITKLQNKEDRLKLIQIGVAAACSANIMLYSVAIYAGAGEIFSGLFGWVSFFLSLPILLFSAIPFYKSSISALKSKSVNIDIPISTAIIIGTFSGLYNLAVGSNHFYFDSIAILVFLLLSSRFVVHKILQSGLNTRGLKSLFNQGPVLRLNSKTNKYESVHSDYIVTNDILLIKKSQSIPCDSIILEGSSFINNSLINGESRPAEVNQGQLVYAGALNISDDLVIQVKKEFAQSTLGKIIEKVESTAGENLDLHSLTSKLSKWFVAGVFSLSIVSFLYFLSYFNLHIAIERTLALIIISCPCALGLASPLALAKAMNSAKRGGIIIKSEKSLEELARAKEVFLDKTGTLTKGNFDVVNVKVLKEIKNINELVYSIEKHSAHPIAQSLVNWSRTNTELVVSDLIEIAGKGITASINEHKYRIEKDLTNSSTNSTVNFFENDELCYVFTLKDELREDAPRLIKFLKNNKVTPTILSGDNLSCVSNIAAEINLPRSSALGDLSPEQKSEIVKSKKGTVMVGDGANDAIAMREAHVSISLRGAMDISLRASDIYLTKNPMLGLIELFSLAKRTYSSIKINLFISLAYNVLGVTLSLMGIVTPLFAAILMPISSLSVVLATLYNLRELKK
ncbi:heavy metal translocating P-type ATPase [Halobacteriovorax sp. HLS]|uniref:heavy metal translocating P-type ATPase n=1 Tax=Halobacteriovorax sp. HLS TaxID=2234000 RepID=UPI000FD81FD8|nr:heavy metal translocating P-type ATPase [Halobacteriovorax sp. HLS]